MGKASGSDPHFKETLQKDAGPRRDKFFDPMNPLRVLAGTVTVTYLPENPDRHRLGVIDETRVANSDRLWSSIGFGAIFAVPGGLVVFGFIILLFKGERLKEPAPPK